MARKNGAYKFCAPLPPPVQLPHPTFHFNQSHKMMIHLAYHLNWRFLNAHVNLVFQIGCRSLSFLRSLIVHSHNLCIILQSISPLLWREFGSGLQKNFQWGSLVKVEPPCTGQQG